MIREKQEGEDIVYMGGSREFGSAQVEVMRLKGDGSGVSISGVDSIPLYKAKAVILSAAVKTLNATAVEVIPAPPSGKFIEIVSAHAMLKFNSAGYDAVGAGDVLELRYTDSSGALLNATVSPVGFADAVADAHDMLHHAASGWAPLNAKVVAHIAVGEWYAAAGDGDLHLEILYRLRDLAI